MTRSFVTFVVVSVILTGCVSEPPPGDAPAAIDPVVTSAPATTGTVSESTSPETTSSTSAAPLDSAISCWESVPPSAEPGIGFEDVTADFDLIDPLTGMYGHAAAWGDPNGDGLPDLIVGTFADRPIENYQVRGATGPSPDRLLSGAPFTALSGAPNLESGRTSGAVFADLDGDGDDDLVLSRNAGLSRQSDVLSITLENRGGLLRPIVDNGMPVNFLGRSIGVLDADQDGLLDLLIVEDRYGDIGTRLLRNTGNLQFEDATAQADLPDALFGLGVATSDANADGMTDFFIGGSNRLFVSDGSLAFHEVTNQGFEWEIFGNEDDVAGAAFADINKDGLPDLVVGHHYNSTVDFGEQVPVRLYLHRGMDTDGDPTFEDVTEEAGLVGLPTKAPHVEIADVDNDGWPDIVTTASADDGTRPAVFRHEGLINGVPRFATPAGLGAPQYWVAGPMADVDRDGRLDILLVEWNPALPSLLLRNTSDSGNWLEISLDVGGRGVGATVSLYESGTSKSVENLLGYREIVVSEGYTAGKLPYAHFGLGDRTTADVVVRLPWGETIELSGVPANQHVRLPNGCGA